MTLTFKELPIQISIALESRAKREGKTVEEVALDLLAGVLIEKNQTGAGAELSELIGSWKEDPEFDEAMKDFERIDADLWK